MLDIILSLLFKKMYFHKVLHVNYLITMHYHKNRMHLSITKYVRNLNFKECWLICILLLMKLLLYISIVQPVGHM